MFLIVITNMSQWIGLPDDIENVFGIVYLIRNNHPDLKNGNNQSSPRYYIGCKQLLKKTRLKANKTRKRDKIVWRDNDVENYWGSSKELLADILKYGPDNFTKEVIEVCNSKFHMKYSELLWQLKCNALMDSRFYNGIINVRLGVVPKNFVDKERDPAILNL